jgi:hypothetical protein
MGDRRPPSALDRVQPEGWLAEYTTELLNVLHVLGLLVEREPAQASLLERICEGPLLEVEVLRAEGALVRPAGSRRGGGEEEDEETGQTRLLL